MLPVVKRKQPSPLVGSGPGVPNITAFFLAHISIFWEPAAHKSTTGRYWAPTEVPTNLHMGMATLVTESRVNPKNKKENTY